MTKKVTYICDRCGKEFEDYERHYRLSEDYFDCSYLEHRWKYIDLCGTCEADLYNFMMQGRKIEDHSGDYPDIPDDCEPEDEFDLD